MKCNNQNCDACNPKYDYIPRLHGWITPDYALQMIDDEIKFLNETTHIATTYKLPHGKVIILMEKEK